MVVRGDPDRRELDATIIVGRRKCLSCSARALMRSPKARPVVFSCILDAWLVGFFAQEISRILEDEELAA